MRVVAQGCPGALQEEEDDREADICEREGVPDEECGVGGEVALKVRDLLARLLQAALERRLQTSRTLRFTARPSSCMKRDGWPGPTDLRAGTRQPLPITCE